MSCGCEANFNLSLDLDSDGEGIFITQKPSQNRQIYNDEDGSVDLEAIQAVQRIVLLMEIQVSRGLWLRNMCWLLPQ